MFNNFDLDGCKILKDAEKERQELCHPYVGSEHLLLSILKNSKDIREIFKLYAVTYEIFKIELIKVIGRAKKEEGINLYTPLLKRIIANAIEDANENNKGKVLPFHYIIALLEESEGIAFRMLLSLNVNVEKLHKSVKNIQVSEKLSINEIGINLNDNVNLNDSVLKRENELNQIIEVLIRRKKNNPILIGEAGVGKTAIVEELARRISLKQVPDFLENKQIIMLEMGSLVAGTKYRGEFEEKLTKIINEVINNGNIILFIDEIHTIINAGGAEGAINAGDILKPYLARGQIKCIGATTPKEYEKTILNDKALSRRFEKITINEPDAKELETILSGVKAEYEQFHQVKITKENIKDIIYYSEKYITNKFNPDKSIDLLDTVCAYVKMKNNLLNNNLKIIKEINKVKSFKEKAIQDNKFDIAIKLKNKEFSLSKKIKEKNINNNIAREDIVKIVFEKTNNPVPELQNKYINEIKEKLNETNKDLHIINDKLVNTLKKLFYGSQDKPFALYLSGNDENIKKKLINTILQTYKKKYPVINIDFKNFNDYSNINKLIGVSAGYIGYGEEYILKNIGENTFAIVFIDNFDEGCESAKNLIKSIIEKGEFLNGKGEKICCTNTKFILSSKLKTDYNVGFCQNRNEYFFSNDLFHVINFDKVDIK